ncbi:MAG: 30S ribosomal protein S2 [Bacteroidia bacterium]|nr:30S ribosomal protein S2 [Bacteroidia bacterium]
MSKANFEMLLEAGAHFGHLRRKWNPAMAPYIFAEKNGIHLIDLHKTVAKLDEAGAALKQIARSGKKVLFVATKKQARNIVAKKVKNINMPYVTERWPGGMLTNFATIRKSIRKMAAIDKMNTDGTYANISKKERLSIARQRAKLETQFGSIADLTRLPAAMFVVDIVKEHIAIAEARKLNIPTFAIVDTNSDPNLVDFPIPANDDASSSIEYIVSFITGAIADGLSERKIDKDKEAEEKEAGGEDSDSKIAKKIELIEAEVDEAHEGSKKEKRKTTKQLIAKKSTPTPPPVKK